MVPMNPLLKSREVAYYLGDSGAKVLFAWHAAAGEAAKGAADTGARVVEVADPLLAARRPGSRCRARADRGDDDDAVILYTSGTTGRPKGAELTHANLTRNAELTADHPAERSPGDVVMGCLPLFHVLRPDLRAERDDHRRQHPDPAAQVRPGQGAGDHRSVTG